MKKLFLFGIGLFLGTTILRGQEAIIKAAPNTISLDGLKNMPRVQRTSLDLYANQAKTTECADTLRYVWTRRNQVGDTNLVGGLIMQTGQKYSQTFLNAGSLTITGVEVWALNFDLGDSPSPSTGTNIVVEVFDVDASNTPTTSLGTATSASLLTATWSGGVDYINVVSFSTPITVTGNYAIAISTTTPSGKMGVFCDTVADGVSYHENLSRYYYLSTWYEVPDLFNGNAEHLSSPIVTYSNTATGTVSPTSAPAGTPITFTNTSDITVFNRMNNYGMFQKYWLNAPQDSVFVWSPSADFSSTSTDLIWAENTTHTYTTDGTYTPGLVVFGGFSKTCLDINDNFIVNIGEDVLPPDCNIGGAGTVCQGQSITLTASVSGASWSVTPEGVVTVNNSGVVAGVAVGTAVVSFTSPNCTNTGTHTVTVNSCASAGVEDIDAFANIVIAPNPTANNIIITGLPEQSMLTITDLNGKILLVKQSNTTQEELSLEQFVNGVYLVNVQSEHANGTHKIMLNK